MTEPLYPLTLKQNIAIERIWRDARWLVGGNPELPAASPRPPFARLMTVGSTFPKYRPVQLRNAALFDYRPELATICIKFIGENLWGDVSLTIGETSVRLDCRADTETIRGRLNFNLDYCRATAFPGLWEFAFGPDIPDVPTITIDPVSTSNSVRFLGGAYPFREAWRSVSSNEFNYDTVKVVDAIPFIEGEVKLGAMTIGQLMTVKSFEETATGERVAKDVDAYLCGQWSCPAFTFRSV